MSTTLNPEQMHAAYNLRKERLALVNENTAIRAERKMVIATIKAHQEVINAHTEVLKEKTNRLNSNTASYLQKGIELEKITGQKPIDIVSTC